MDRRGEVGRGRAADSDRAVTVDISRAADSGGAAESGAAGGDLNGLAASPAEGDKLISCAYYFIELYTLFLYFDLTSGRWR